MRKIPTVFVRSEIDRKIVTDNVTSGCEWVFDDPTTIATRKYDGTCVMLDSNGRWWARHEVKPGKVAPESFVAVETDPITGKTVGWEPIEQSGFHRYLSEAILHTELRGPGTYELVGPKVNGNPERQDTHVLVYHAKAQTLDDVPRDFNGLADWLLSHPYEGIVWHHEDGRMAKLKRCDFPAGK